MFFTQQIYNSGYLALFSVLSLLLAVIISYYFRYDETSFFESFVINSLTSYYFIVLLFFKGCYVKLNNFLISKDLVHMKHLNKDFTYLHWNEHSPDWWDEKRALPPSWLDTILTLLVFIIPLLMMVFFRNFF